MLLIPIQLILASLLIVAGSGVAILWLALLTQSYGNLLGWIGAGVILYGLIVVVFAGALILPGYWWIYHIELKLPRILRAMAKLLAKAGVFVLAISLVIAIIVLGAEAFRPKTPDKITWIDPKISPIQSIPSKGQCSVTGDGDALYSRFFTLWAEDTGIKDGNPTSKMRDMTSAEESEAFDCLKKADAINNCKAIQLLELAYRYGTLGLDIKQNVVSADIYLKRKELYCSEPSKADH